MINGYHEDNDGFRYFIEGIIQFSANGLATNPEPRFNQSASSHNFLDFMAEYAKKPVKHPLFEKVMADPFFSLFFKAAKNPDIYFISEEDSLRYQFLSEQLGSKKVRMQGDAWHNKPVSRQLILDEVRNSNWGAIILPTVTRTIGSSHKRMLMDFGVSRTVFIPLKNQFFTSMPESLIEFDHEFRGLTAADYKILALEAIYDSVNSV